jgi:hypothetical protein
MSYGTSTPYGSWVTHLALFRIVSARYAKYKKVKFLTKIVVLTSAASNIFLNGMLCFTFTVISGHSSSICDVLE